MLAAAVANTVDVGMLGLTWPSRAAARDQLRRTNELTGRPVGVT